DAYFPLLQLTDRRSQIADRLSTAAKNIYTSHLAAIRSSVPFLSPEFTLYDLSELAKKPVTPLQ
ncbi:MAG TPA: hypothetical protein VGP24_16680, partial [Glaciihabitans sp.]|nr:hypothetical protein [Glaciihabitans sp.]